MSTPLDQSIKDRLNANKGDWPTYATKTGVSYSWICKFARGKIPRPGFTPLQKLDGVLPRLAKPVTQPEPEPAA